MDASPADRPARSERLAFGAGLCLAVLAAIVLAGWLTGDLMLVQVLRGAVPMRFNTAVLHLLVGCSFMAASSRHRCLVRRISAIVAAWAAASMSQDLLGIDLGIDNLLYRDWSNIGPNASGRMAVNTATCFVLASLCLVSQSYPCRYRNQPLVECLLSSLVLAIALVSAAGYASGLSAAYGWGGQAGMAIHTALAFTLIGGTLFCLALGHERKWAPASVSPAWLPVPIGLAALTVNLIIWQALCLEEQIQIDRNTALRAQKLAGQIKARLLERTQGMERMAQRWATAGQPLRQHWKEDAALYLRHFSDLQSIAWVDPTATVRWIEPLAGNEAALNLDNSREPVRRGAFLLSKEERRSAITPIIRLVQGGQGVLVVSPICSADGCEGYISAALRIDDLVSNVAQEDLDAGYQVAVFDGTRPAADPGSPAGPTSARSQNAVVSFGGMSCVIRIWPSARAVAAQQTSLPAAVFAGGCILSVLLLLLTHLAQRAREQKRAAERAAEALRASQWRFRAIFDQTFQFIGLLTTDGTVVEANRTALSFAGISEAEVIGKPFWQTPWWRHSIDLQQQLRDAIDRAAQGECICFEASHLSAEGETRFVDFSLKPFYDEQGQIHLLVPEGRDITDRKRAEEKLTRAARLDKLTGLPNRGLLLDRLQQVILRAQRARDYRYALMFLDFDRFKLINDSLGHEAGDDLLRQIACRLRGNVRSLDSINSSAIGNTTARLGGDEFIVLLDELEQPSDVLIIAKRLLRVFSQPFRLGSQDVHSTASIGIVMGGPEYERADELLRDADTAMYEAKKAGRARFVVFDASMREHLQRRLRLESDLRKAIEANELTLVYQPILSLVTGEICSVEALLRWTHPDDGPISPSEFVAIAEESDLIHRLGQWSLVAGCRQMAAWINKFGPVAPPTVSINLSLKQFSLPDLPARLQKALAETGLEASRLQLEIAEGALGADEQTAAETMREIRKLGAHLAIDDFGSGSFSFTAVHRFPVDMLKVHRSLLAGIEDSPDTAALIHALAVLVKNLGICMVAEGVETPSEALALQELGCLHAQGYFLASPMTATEFEQFASRSAAIDHEATGALAFAARWASRLSL